MLAKARPVRGLEQWLGAGFHTQLERLIRQCWCLRVQ